ncbi:MAG: MFS transporter [Candidatus Carbobacillus sp.]|nr:MFS transporter [Candidatus Carbobacillus sp.]
MTKGLLRLWNQWASYNRNIKLILLTQLLFSIGMGMFMIVYNLYVRALGYEQIIVGEVVSSMAYGTALALVPAGILSDRLSRKKLVVFGGMMTVSTLFLRSVLEQADGLIHAAFVEGVFAALIQVSFVPLLSEYSREEERVHLFSMLFALNMGANIFGNLGGGFMSDGWMRMFGMSEVLSLRWTLFVSIMIIMAAIVPMMKIQETQKKVKTKAMRPILTEIQEQQVTTGHRASLFNFIKVHFPSLRLIFLFSIAQLFIGFGAGLVIPYLNLYFADRFAASASVIGLIVSLGQAATALAMLFGPMVVRRFGEVKAIVVLQLASIPFLLLTGLTNILFLAALGYLFRQALMNAGTPIQMSMMMNKVHERFRGLANSISAVNFNLGWALMGPVSMQIVQAKGPYWGYAIVFMITALLYLVGSIYFYMIFRDTNERAYALSVKNRI